MAFSQDDLDKLQAAYVSGVLEVEYADKKIKYRSLAEMKEIIDTVTASLEGPKRRTRYAMNETGHYRR